MDTSASVKILHVGYLMLVDQWDACVDTNVVERIEPGVLLEELQENPTLDSTSVDSRIFLQIIGQSHIKFHISDIPRNKFEKVSEIEFGLLRPIEKSEDRYHVFQDKDWLEEGVELKIGDEVTIQNIQGMPPDTSGKIRLKGPLENYLPGIHFGIELDEEYSGHGTSSGTFRHRLYFKSNENCALFLSILKIRRKMNRSSTPNRLAADAGESILQLSLRSDTRPRPNNTNEQPPLNLNEEVVWISDNGPEHGTVKWIGQIPDLDPMSHEDWYAGVAFRNPIGKGTGRYKGKQLFSARKDHASLVPVVGLLRLADYETINFTTSLFGTSTSHTNVSISNSRRSDATSVQSASGTIPDFSDIVEDTSSSGSPESDNVPGTHPKHQVISHFRPVEDAETEQNMSMQRMPGGGSGDSSTNFYTENTSIQREVSAPHISRFQQISAQGQESMSQGSMPITLGLQSDTQFGVQPKSSAYESRESSTFGPPAMFLADTDESPSASTLDKQLKMDVQKGFPVGSSKSTDIKGKSNIRNFQIGDAVEVILTPPRYGIIRWLGRSSKPRRDPETIPPLIAGLYMENEDPLCHTDGTYEGKRVFSCGPHRAFFIYMSKCRPDSRTKEDIVDPNT